MQLIVHILSRCIDGGALNKRASPTEKKLWQVENIPALISANLKIRVFPLQQEQETLT
jgi:hypothetical protein